MGYWFNCIRLNLSILPSQSDFLLPTRFSCRSYWCIWLHAVTNIHPHSVRLLWTSERPVTETSTDDTQHAQQTFMPPPGFEPGFPANERPPTHVLDCTVTGIGRRISANKNYASAKHFLWICSIFIYFTNMFGVFLLTSFLVDAMPLKQMITIMWIRCKR